MAENVTNVRVRQEGKSIVVTYNLSQKSVVRLLMASGTSEAYTELQAVTGDVGNVAAGKNCKVVWNWERTRAMTRTINPFSFVGPMQSGKRKNCAEDEIHHAILWKSG